MSLEDIAENGQEWAEIQFKSLKKWIERDGFKYEDGRLSAVRNHQDLAGISDAVAHLDLPELHRQIERVNAAVEDDPALAIGTAKELVEIVCKTIPDRAQYRISAGCRRAKAGHGNAAGSWPRARVHT